MTFITHNIKAEYLIWVSLCGSKHREEVLSSVEGHTVHLSFCAAEKYNRDFLLSACVCVDTWIIRPLIFTHQPHSMPTHRVDSILQCTSWAVAATHACRHCQQRTLCCSSTLCRFFLSRVMSCRIHLTNKTKQWTALFMQHFSVNITLHLHK